MDPGPWAAYSPHYQRLGAGGVNPSASPLSQAGQLNDLSLSASLPRQDSIGGYGSPAPPLLLSHHGLNVGQGGHHGDAGASFMNVNSAGLLGSGYDPMISATFQSSAKSHLSALNVPHGAGLYKAMKDSEIGDLRGGFVRRGMTPGSMTSDPNMTMASSSGLFTPQAPPPPHSWRHSNIVTTATSSPFGVLPHEAVLPRSSVADSMDKLHSQDHHRSKPSRMMMDTGRYMEQDLASAAAAAAHSYRNVLSAQGRSPVMMDPTPSSRSSLVMQQSESLGPGTDGLGLAGLKATDYALYSNSNVNAAARGLLSQNYIPQSHFPTHQELQGDKRDLYDLSLLSDKVESYGSSGNSSAAKSHLDLFGVNSQSGPGSAGSGNSGSLHGVSPSPSQRTSSHRTGSSSSQSHGSGHNRSMCSNPSPVRSTPHSATYATYSSTSTVASYTQSYHHASPQLSPSQALPSPVHYSAPSAVDFSSPMPQSPASTSQYSQSASVLPHSDSPGVVYSSVITRASVPHSNTGTYTNSMTSHKPMSSKTQQQQQQQQHLVSQGESKMLAPTPPPVVTRSYEPVIRATDLSSDSCMPDLVSGNHGLPPATPLQRMTNTPTGGGSRSGSNMTPIDHNMMHSPSLAASGVPQLSRASSDATCPSPAKSLSMEPVFNSQQMTLQDLADMSSSSDKMDLESEPVGLMPSHKESLVVDEEPHLMDLSQPPHPQSAPPPPFLQSRSSGKAPGPMIDRMEPTSHKKTEEKPKKKRIRKKQKQSEDVIVPDALQGTLGSPTGAPPPPSHLAMMPMGMPSTPMSAVSHGGEIVSPVVSNHIAPPPMCSPDPGTPIYPQQRCLASPLMNTNGSYQMTGGHMYPNEPLQQESAATCLESTPPQFGQNGTMGVSEGMVVGRHMLQQPSPPLASLFEPVSTSPQGNAEAVAFEEQLRHEASQIAKKLDRRIPSIEDDLGFLAELPPACNVACERRKTEAGKVGGIGGAPGNNFIDSFLKFLEGGEQGPGGGEVASGAGGRTGGRGRGKSRETFTTPPKGKRVELNPATGLFTCTDKDKMVAASSSSAAPKYPKSVSRKNTDGGRFDGPLACLSSSAAAAAPTPPSSAKDDVLPLSSSLTFSSDEEEGMANQGFVDSVKMALQSLSDNEGYGANQESPAWGGPPAMQPAVSSQLYGNHKALQGGAGGGVDWSESKMNPKEDHMASYGTPKMNSVTAAGKSALVESRNKFSNSRKLAGANSDGGLGQQIRAMGSSADNDLSDYSDKEFFDLAMPKECPAVQKLKGRAAVPKPKEKAPKRKRQSNDVPSNEFNHSSSLSSSKMDCKPDNVCDPRNNSLWTAAAKSETDLRHNSLRCEEDGNSKWASGLRGKRKGHSPVLVNSPPRGGVSNRHQWSPGGEEPNSDQMSNNTKMKKSRPRGRPKLSKFPDTKDDHRYNIKDGGFKNGNFVMLQSDKGLLEPPIWKIESHGTLQKFEPFKDGDRLLYRGQHGGSVLKMGPKAYYEPIAVLVLKSDRTAEIVEHLKDYHRGSSRLHAVSKMQDEDESLSQKENFEVYLQTLISQVLDPNFISEIVKENDEYFLSHVHEIDGIVVKKKFLLAKKMTWNPALRDCADCFPVLNVRPFTTTGSAKVTCQACSKERMTLCSIMFDGPLYDPTTLGFLRDMPAGKKLNEREFTICSECAEMVQAYAQMQHQKYNLFVTCTNKVNSIRSVDPTQESHVILEQCLQDSSWINKLFCKIRNVWKACSALCR